jgi:hypothetical protein
MLAKKWFFMGIFALLSVSLVFADPPAVHPKTGEELVINVFRGTPNAIDGDLSDWNLSAMTPAVLDTQEQLSDDSLDKANWDNPEDISGKFYLLWDDENIYIAVVVKDDRLSMNKTGTSIWNADAVEVFFSTPNAVSGHDEHYQYGFNANEQKWNWCNMDIGGQSEPDYLQIASSLTDEGYICEVSIAYGQILALDFSVGNTIGFHPILDDTDNGDRELQMTWTGRADHDQSQGFGQIILSDVAVGNDAPIARQPEPKDGAVHDSFFGILSWKSGLYADSHDVYIGDNFNDVNDGTGGTFIGNRTKDLLVVGFPGFPFPNGLDSETTYYWRVDEVNDANPESPWKGNIWSFSVLLPLTAWDHEPDNGAEFVDLDTTFTWRSGYGAQQHIFYLGESFVEVNNATAGITLRTPSYSPGPLEREKVLYWRVDEFDGNETHKGDVLAFTTPGAAGNSWPANGETDVPMTVTLEWRAADNATSHELYFGTDANAVKNATKASPEYVGARPRGSESFEPGKLAWHTKYYWRVDAVYPTETIKGLVWSFETAAFLTVDDFESYNNIDPPDAASNRIFDKWIDGFGTTTNGALVGHDRTPYTERYIVHGGHQSMNFRYDNAGKTSEATLTLVERRNWTDEGVTKLSLWHWGKDTNAPDRIYIALNDTAVVYCNDPAATQLSEWRNWVIDLVAFGVNLTDVDSITIGIGTKDAPLPGGGTGMMYFDDIRLYR